MSTLHSSLYAIALMSCVLGSFVTRTTMRGSHYLMVYLALESLGFIFEWLMLHPTSPGKSLWLGLLMCVSFLLAPCVSLYAREITERPRPSIRSLSTGEVCVIAGGMLLTLPLIQASHFGPDYAEAAGSTNQLPWSMIHDHVRFGGDVSAASALLSSSVPSTHALARGHCFPGPARGTADSAAGRGPQLVREPAADSSLRHPG
ncbi:hypothetical protein HNQ60_005011 [Povalibacter uvarum]|uniref:Uncharacterized protein n=1 Tax=Povalibacter uvarum TaxID=732238 RepID=A0A841HVA5_9GAMM|nr:hypothetical protein [Povalibacter uvarum]MBB6096120.1 hypothetical protein [Povalibacter uvarum]